MQYHVDKAVRRDVDKVPVVCENEELGCGWSGTLASHEVTSLSLFLYTPPNDQLTTPLL